MENREQHIRQWWKRRRLRYNIGLVISGVTAFVLYAILGSFYGNNDFEITLFTTFFQGIGYLFMMGLANIFYFLGPFVDRRQNMSNSERFRERLFNLGFWFSCSLPFTVPLLLVLAYLLKWR